MAHSLPKGRIPTRPLSYIEKEKRFPKEILIDYDNCRIYISDSEGNIHDSIIEIAEILKNNPDIFSNVKVTIEGIGEVTLQGAFNNVLDTIDTLESTITALSSKIGQPNGIASLDGDGKIPSIQLPAYVDDVLEFPTLASFPVVGEKGKIYVTLDDNKTYRWSGSVYIEISQGVSLGITSTTAHRGDHGKAAYDHISLEGNPHNSKPSDIGAVASIEKGAINGVATLDNAGKVLASQLPDMNYNKRFQNIGGAFDFNNITDDGIHMRIGVATNSPYGVVSDQSFAIHVYKYDNMHLHQVAYDMKNNSRAERSLIYGTWGKWILKNSLDIYPSNSISDLNTFETPGILTLAASVTNIPPGEGFYAVVYNFCGAVNNYLVQYYFAAGSRKTWVRSRVDGVWDAWRQVADSTNALMYGNGIGEAGKFDNSTDPPTATNYLRYNGQFRATKVFGMYFSDSADYAESYNVVGEFNKGDLICLDTDGSFVRNTKALNTKVLGFVSTEPGSVFGGTDGAPIALAGRVPVNTYGIVNSGDYLVGSYEPGCVMSWDIENSPRGSIVGMALEGNDKGNKSQVMAFVVRM